VGKSGKHANMSSWEKVENMPISRRGKKWKTCQEVDVQEKRKKFDKKLSLKKKEGKEKV